MNQIKLLALVLLVACSTPSSGPLVTVDSAAPAPPPPAAEETPLRRMRPPAGPVAPPVPDPRTPQQLAQAACAGGFCRGTQVKPLLAAGGSTPIIPASWTVPAWFIDPANSATCASDQNSGTAATCTGGCSGATCPSGIGPIATFQELNVHRWGCQGNPVACPRLRQNTTLTFLSSHTDNSDPVVLLPELEAGAWEQVTASLPTPSCTGTLAGVVSKARATNQALNATLCGTTSTRQLIVNTTHPSRAWAYKVTAGSTYLVTQPMVAQTIPTTTNFPAEVDTWANLDVYNSYTPVAVNLVRADATLADNATPSFNNALYIYNITVFSPQGGSTGAPFIIGANAWLEESLIRRIAVFNTDPGVSGTQPNVNVDFSAGIVVPQNINTDLNFVGLHIFNGGALGAPTGSAVQHVGSSYLDQDVILGGPAPTTMNDGFIGPIYIDTGSQLQTTGLIDFKNGSLFLTTYVAYGPGQINASGSSRWIYPAGAAAGAAAFKLAGGLLINGQTKGCIAQPGAGTIGACNTTCATGANLDTANGATTGCCAVVGGASFCNGAQ